MKLDRSLNKDGHGKYALLKLRKLRELSVYNPVNHPPPTSPAIHKILEAVKTLERAGIIDYGTRDDGSIDPEREFFVMRLKDVHAYDALMAYARSVMKNKGTADKEYRDEIVKMASRAGTRNPFWKYPD